jgi:hypothetical protein
MFIALNGNLMGKVVPVLTHCDYTDRKGKKGKERKFRKFRNRKEIP